MKDKTNRRINKKGFTLVELVAVIGILGAIVLLAMPNFLSTSRNVSGKEILYNIKMVEYSVTMNETMNQEDVIDLYGLLEVDRSDIQSAYDEKRLFNKDGYAQISHIDGFYNLNDTPITEDISGSTDGTFVLKDKDVYFIADKSVNVDMEYTEDTIPPVITVDTFPIDPTNQDVTICASTNEGYLDEACHTFTENGSFDFIATDVAGNKTIETVVVDFIDKEPPIIAFSRNGDTNPKKSHQTSVTVSDLANNIEDGSLKYAWSTSTPSSGWSSFSNGDTLTKDTDTGNYYLYIEAADDLGNSHIVRSEAFNVDNTAPTKPTISAETSTGIGYVDIIYSADSAQKEYKIDSGAWTAYINQLVLNNNATVYSRGIDLAGNVSEVAEMHVVVDIEPPVVTFTKNGSTDYEKVDSTKVSVSDGKSGVDASSLKYKWTTTSTQPVLDGTWTSFSSGDTIGTGSGLNGTYYLHVYAKDTVGNDGITTSNAFRLDNIAPVITIGSYGTGWTNQDIVVTASTNEGTLNKTSHAFTTNGSYLFTAVDEAGNTSSKAVTITNIDKNNPTEPFIHGSNDWYVSNASITIDSAFDSESGLDRIEYRLDSGTWTTYSSPIVISKDGITEVEARSLDLVGNVSTISTKAIKKDKVAPIIILSKDGDSTEMSSHSTTVTTSDTHSGIKISQYAWSTSTTRPPDGSSAWISLASGTTVTTPISDGKYYLHVKAEDTAGNTINFRSNLFNVAKQYTYFKYTVKATTSYEIKSWHMFESGLVREDDSDYGSGVDRYLYPSYTISQSTGRVDTSGERYRFPSNFNSEGDPFYSPSYSTTFTMYGSGVSSEGNDIRKITYQFTSSTRTTYRRIKYLGESEIVTTESKGSYTGFVTGNAAAYPTNGKHDDGYWYVRQ